MLGALDTGHHQQLEKRLEEDHELKEQLLDLRQRIAPLEQLTPPGLPPAGLARRTCEFVASHPRRESRWQRPATTALASQPRRRWFSANSLEPGARRRNSVMDFVIVVVVIMLLAAVALPALNNSRFQSQRLACQNNLRTVGMGLLEYSENSGGRYVQMPPTGNLSFAGVYAPELMERGFVKDPNAFLCAGAGRARQHEVPTLRQLLEADPQSLRDLQKRAGGDYAYTMGQIRNGVHDVGENLHRSGFILIADNPSGTLPGWASDHHGGHGQNVFFEDGRVQFLELPEYEGDAIYVNDWGTVGPGASADDIVLAPSATKLINFRVD